MLISDQIIAVLDDLCQRLGIVIDWSQQNIMPYIETLAVKYIKYEIWTSVAWCAITASILIIVIVFTKFAYKNDFSELLVIGTIFSIITAIALFFVVGQQVFDIIECCTIPEKTLIELISALMKRS